jgi:hypothetical protein
MRGTTSKSAPTKSIPAEPVHVRGERRRNTRRREPQSRRGTRPSTMNAQQAIQWPHITHIPLYMQHTTAHHPPTRSIDQAVHSTASAGTRCAAILPLPVLLSAGRRTMHFGWCGQFRGVIHGKTTPEDIYNADTLLMYSSRVRACLNAVVAATFAVMSYNFSSVDGCLQVFEQTLHRWRAVSRDSICALVPVGLVVRGARGCGVEERLMNELSIQPARGI